MNYDFIKKQIIIRSYKNNKIKLIIRSLIIRQISKFHTLSLIFYNIYIRYCVKRLIYNNFFNGTNYADLMI